MAFSNDQKKQLSVMIDSPQDFLKKCKNKEIYLPGFSHEFFKDGDGIFHLLAECIIKNENTDYLAILEELLDKDSKLNIFQKTGRKNNAVSSLIEAVKKDTSLISIVTNILIKSRSYFNNDDKYQIISFINFLAEKNELEKIELLLKEYPQFNKDNYLIKALLTTAIDKNNTNLIDILINNKDMISYLNENIGALKFNTEKSNFTAKNVNVYSFAVNRRSKESLLKLTNIFKDKINFNGTLQISKTNYYEQLNTQTIIHPLNEILNKINSVNKENIDFFNSFYLAMPFKDKVDWITLGNNRINAVYEVNCEKEIFNDFEQLFKSEEVENIKKLKVFNELLHLSKMHEGREFKYQKIKQILDPFWDYIPEPGALINNIGSKFLFTSFQSDGNMSTAEIDAFVNIFQKLKEKNHIEYLPVIFGKAFFNEPELARKLIKEGLNIESLPDYRNLGKIEQKQFNIFELYLVLAKEKRDNITKNNTYKYDSNLEKAEETLSFLFKNYRHLIHKPCFSEKFRDYHNKTTIKEKILLEVAIKNNNKEIFKFLEEEDLNVFKKDFEETIVKELKGYSSYTKEARENFSFIIKKLFEANYNFTIEENEKPIYYSFFDKVSDLSLLSKIIKKFNIDLTENANDSNFWLSINTENSLPLLKEKLTSQYDKQKIKKVLTILSSSDTFNNNLITLLEIYPELIKMKLSDDNNILHNAIQNDALSIAKEIIEKHPELVIQTNKQNKMPVSYFISSFAKKITKEGDRFLDEKEKYKNLFVKIIGIGLNSENKKGNKILEDQLKKYSIIEETFPEIVKEYNYHKLNAILSPNENIITKKLKI